MRIIPLCLISVLFLAQSSYAWLDYGSQGVQTAVAKASTTAPYGFYEYLPQTYDSETNKRWPLVLFFHGVGECTPDKPLSSVLANGPPKNINSGTHYPAVVISPQTTAWPAAATTKQMLDYILQYYRIDLDKVYITGLSMGGGVTWNLVSYYPQLIAAAVPICGANDIPHDGAAFTNFNVWAFHAKDDGTVSVNQTYKWANEAGAYFSPPTTTPIQNNMPASGDNTACYVGSSTWNWLAGTLPSDAQSRFRVTIYGSGGHGIWSRAYTDNNMWNWLWQQTKLRESIHITVNSFTASRAHVSDLSNTTVVFTADVVSTNGTITNVSMNLNPLGGSPLVKMKHAGGNIYVSTNLILPGASVGTQTVTITIRDTNKNYKNGYTKVLVTHPPIGITVKSHSLSPTTLSDVSNKRIFMYLHATNVNALTTNVSVNLTALGGPSLFKLKQSGNIFTNSYLLQAWTFSPGSVNIPFYVTDTYKNSVIASVPVTVTHPANGVRVQSIQLSPHPVLNVSNTRMRVAIDTRSTNAFVTNVTLNLYSFGGGYLKLLQAGGNLFTNNLLVAAGTSAGIRYLPARIVDHFKNERSTNIPVTIVSPPNAIKIDSFTLDPKLPSANVKSTLFFRAVTTSTNSPSMSSVVLDLTSLGGTVNVPMVAGASNSYAYSFLLPKGLTASSYMVPMTVTDLWNNIAMSNMTIIVSNRKVKEEYELLSGNPLDLRTEGSLMRIGFTSATPEKVKISIFSMTGELVKELDPEGKAYVEWDGSNRKGRSVSTGHYFVVMTVKGKKEKLPVVKIGVIR